MSIVEIIKQPENRRLEFKRELPVSSDLAKTIIAFSNDAGGEIFIGIQDSPRIIAGVPEADLIQIEEQISNLIYDNCIPTIIPEISAINVEDKYILRVKIYRGNNFPYYLKSKGKTAGTYIRVGSSNRQATEDMVIELERQKHNISFDSVLYFNKPFEDIYISEFKKFYKEKTGEKIEVNSLKKFNLISFYQNELKPTNALILFSDDELKKSIFPYAKIECARFKGINTDEFIDQKTIDGNIISQAELAYKFILRHINKEAHVNGIYTESRWEYPITAIREVLRNAVVHRDYSLTGKDIKIAIYDDMVEITSPGLLLPSIDFSEMEARQSDIRNKIIAPVFKKIGIIDQWGNGLKLIANELKNYPEIEFKWIEKGLQFQVQFIKKEYKHTNVSVGKTRPGYDQAATKLRLSNKQIKTVLKTCKVSRTRAEVLASIGFKNHTDNYRKYLLPLITNGLISQTIPEFPTSPNQKYIITKNGEIFLKKQTSK